MAISDKQLAANRANAARSTGPRTPEGKARSAQNSRKHGFCAADYAVVRLEDLEHVARLREDLIAFYQPANSEELFAIERMALAQNAILRAARLESGMFTMCLDECLEPTTDDLPPWKGLSPELVKDNQVTHQQNRNYALAQGLHGLVRQSSAWSLLLRYQAQAERQYRRALEEFERLKALRPQNGDCHQFLPSELAGCTRFAPSERPLPNEPIVKTQLEANTTTSTSVNEPSITLPPLASRPPANGRLHDVEP